MGRFFRNSRLQILPGALYHAPSQAMMQVIKEDNSGRDNLLTRTDALNKTLNTIAHLTEDNDNVKKIQDLYNTKINDISNIIYNDVDALRKVKPLMQQMTNDMIKDSTTGLWSAVTNRYNAFTNWLQANKDIEQKDNMTYKLGYNFYKQLLKQGLENDSMFVFSPENLIAKPDISKEVMEAVAKMHPDAVTKQNGLYIIKDKYLNDKRIMNTAIGALMSNPNYYPYLRQMTKFGLKGYLDDNGNPLPLTMLVDDSGKPVTKEDFVKMNNNDRLKVREILNPANPFYSDISRHLPMAYHQQDLSANNVALTLLKLQQQREENEKNRKLKWRMHEDGKNKNKDDDSEIVTHDVSTTHDVISDAKNENIPYNQRVISIQNVLSKNASPKISEILNQNIYPKGFNGYKTFSSILSEGMVGNKIFSDGKENKSLFKGYGNNLQDLIIDAVGKIGTNISALKNLRSEGPFIAKLALDAKNQHGKYYLTDKKTREKYQKIVNQYENYFGVNISDKMKFTKNGALEYIDTAGNKRVINTPIVKAFNSIIHDNTNSPGFSLGLIRNNIYLTDNNILRDNDENFDVGVLLSKFSPLSNKGHFNDKEISEYISKNVGLENNSVFTSVYTDKFKSLGDVKNINLDRFSDFNYYIADNNSKKINVSYSDINKPKSILLNSTGTQIRITDSDGEVYIGIPNSNTKKTELKNMTYEVFGITPYDQKINQSLLGNSVISITPEDVYVKLASSNFKEVGAKIHNELVGDITYNPSPSKLKKVYEYTIPVKNDKKYIKNIKELNKSRDYKISTSVDGNILNITLPVEDNSYALSDIWEILK